MKIIKHFNLILKHKWYVFKNCFKAGIYWQGVTHDLSKLSPTEFFESVKYYTGDKSPIDNCKSENGYSKAWQHHKGKNPHHYEYWVDNFDHGGTPIQMPFKYALELVCDYIAAGQAYQGKQFTYKNEYQWWLQKISNPIKMHPQTILFVNNMLSTMAKENNNNCLKKKQAKDIYFNSSLEYHYSEKEI